MQDKETLAMLFTCIRVAINRTLTQTAGRVLHERQTSRLSWEAPFGVDVGRARNAGRLFCTNETISDFPASNLLPFSFSQSKLPPIKNLHDTELHAQHLGDFASSL